MRYNTHCHVFNLQSVFTEGTAFILQKRLDDGGLSTGFAQAIVGELRSYLAHGGGVDAVTPDPLDSNSPWPKTLDERLRRAKQGFQLAMLKNMDQVTDYMMQQQDGDVIFVPLMMDILLAPQTGPKIGDIFEAQVAGTQRQALRHRGRILPFFAVNPYRWDFVNRAVRAIEREGFIGVKLYPSLGYDIYAPGMDGIMHYCHSNDIPILMHCSPGGFKQNDSTAQNCAPGLWGGDGYLKRYPRLKVCFAHFGGAQNFKGADVLTTPSWTKDILDLMQAFPGQVYADVAYHDEALDPGTRAKYFESLAAILANNDLKPYVLFGTDSWLLHMVCRELGYWAAFWPDGLSQENFVQISRANSRAFLGIAPVSTGKNILNYMEFMQKNGGWARADAQAWLMEACA